MPDAHVSTLTTPPPAAATATVALTDQLQRWLAEAGSMLQPPAPNQLYARVDDPASLLALAAHLRAAQCFLVTVVANDERELEDGWFKIYYLFSCADVDLFMLVEHRLAHASERYPSLYAVFPAVDPFEREMVDLFGLRPEGERSAQVPSGGWLHAAYPPALHPLRRDRTTAYLKQQVQAYNVKPARSRPVPANAPLPAGFMRLVAGPIHAGIIEPGRFVFRTAGEVIDDLELELGYTHRGIERLFQARMTLANGWQLAEQVSGDTSFGHSLGYCLAAEALAGVEVSQPAQVLRGLCLELERLHNHVGDTAQLAHDVAQELLASELAVVREQLLRLNAALCGHRYLRGVNRPGGVVLPAPFDAVSTGVVVQRCVRRYADLADALAANGAFRERTKAVGWLSRPEALALGVTGLPARAAGLARDFRYLHPNGIYRAGWIQAGLQAATAGVAPDDRVEARQGDVFARFWQRKLEVDASAQLVGTLLDHWLADEPLRGADGGPVDLLRPVRFDPARNFTFALGYCEGWRGDIVYWLMQDKLGRIFRCKVRDPSLLNWPALRQSLLPRLKDGRRHETILADFPVVNKSFNLSYAGHDL